jgi:hypothetical protein
MYVEQMQSSVNRKCPEIVMPPQDLFSDLEMILRYLYFPLLENGSLHRCATIRLN